MRLIDATRIEQFILNNCSDNEEINTIYGELINAPDIDLIRCGECKHWYRNKPPIDEECDIFPNADDFCSYGERKSDCEDETDEEWYDWRDEQEYEDRWERRADEPNT